MTLADRRRFLRAWPPRDAAKRLGVPSEYSAERGAVGPTEGVFQISCGTQGHWCAPALIGRILTLRAEKAELLGKPQFADLVVERRMAGADFLASGRKFCRGDATGD